MRTIGAASLGLARAMCQWGQARSTTSFTVSEVRRHRLVGGLGAARGRSHQDALAMLRNLGRSEQILTTNLVGRLKHVGRRRSGDLKIAGFLRVRCFELRRFLYDPLFAGGGWRFDKSSGSPFNLLLSIPSAAQEGLRNGAPTRRDARFSFA